MKKGQFFTKRFFLTFIITGTLLAISSLRTSPGLSYVPGWVNFQNFGYQYAPFPHLYPFSLYPIGPVGMNFPGASPTSPWPGPFLPCFSYGQSLLSLSFGLTHTIHPWNVLLPNNQFLTGKISPPLTDMASIFTSPLQALALANGFPGGYVPGTGSLFPWQGPFDNLSTLLEPTPFGPILRLPKARTAAAVIPPPQPPPAPLGIDVPLFVYKPPVRQSAGLFIPGMPGYVNGQVLVTFQPGTPVAEMSRVYTSHQFRELYTSPFAGFKILALPPYLTVLDAARSLSLEPSVLHTSPNYYRHAHLLPNDPYYRYQWHLPRLNSSWAWDFSTGAGALVGLLDSGVAYQTAGIYAKAPDLAGTLFAPGYDFINIDTSPDDDYGHGTHMAGCIAQTTNNYLGAAGVAFNATIMPVKVMDNAGNAPISAEVDGIYFAANSGVNIISMSLGGQGADVTEQAAVTYAYDNGVTLICSAGNGINGVGTDVPEYPASYPECISVSAIRYDYTRPTYSNYGAYIDVCSPGGDLSVDQNVDGNGDGILQQTHNGTDVTTFYYCFMEGTSPAAALVSGVAALIVSKSTIPLSPLDVTNILKGSATDLGAAGWDEYYGSGLVNAYLAVLQTP